MKKITKAAILAFITFLVLEEPAFVCTVVKMFSKVQAEKPPLKGIGIVDKSS